VRLINKDKVEWFICLLDPCFKVNKPVVIKCTKMGALNACTHLDKKHCITSSKTMATNKKLADIKSSLVYPTRLSKKTQSAGLKCSWELGSSSSRPRTTCSRPVDGNWSVVSYLSRKVEWSQSTSASFTSSYTPRARRSSLCHSLRRAHSLRSSTCRCTWT